MRKKSEFAYNVDKTITSLVCGQGSMSCCKGCVHLIYYFVPRLWLRKNSLPYLSLQRLATMQKSFFPVSSNFSFSWVKQEASTKYLISFWASRVDQYFCLKSSLFPLYNYQAINHAKSVSLEVWIQISFT